MIFYLWTTRKAKQKEKYSIKFSVFHVFFLVFFTSVILVLKMLLKKSLGCKNRNDIIIFFKDTNNIKKNIYIFSYLRKWVLEQQHRIILRGSGDQAPAPEVCRKGEIRTTGAEILWHHQCNLRSAVSPDYEFGWKETNSYS